MRVSGSVEPGKLARAGEAPAIGAAQGGETVNSAIVFTYSRAHLGREGAAFEAFQDAMTFFGKLAADGKCLEPEVFLGPYAKGIMVVKGERDVLWEITNSDDFKRFYLKTAYSVPDIGFELFYFGEGTMDFMGLWSKVGKEFDFM
jgi:hypothetical protein